MGSSEPITGRNKRDVGDNICFDRRGKGGRKEPEHLTDSDVTTHPQQAQSKEVDSPSIRDKPAP